MVRKLVYGVGINDADYVTQINENSGYNEDGKKIQKMIWVCPFSKVWRAMIGRCYSVKIQERQPSYVGCQVTPEWHYFMTFRDWMIEQDWEGKALDKDLLIAGNKTYSPETCVFISQTVNSFLLDSKNSRGEFPVGVSFNKCNQKFEAKCGNVETKKQEYLGMFNDAEEAHQVYREFKYKQAVILASMQADPRVAEALIDRYRFS